MQAFQIQDTREFMHQLFQTDTFHTFQMTEASVTTMASYRIDGTFHPDFLDTEEQSAVASTAFDTESAARSSFPRYCTWKMLQPQVFSLIRGKHTPLSLRIIFRLADYNVDKLLRNNGIPIDTSQVGGLFLNIYYEKGKLSCTSGTSLNIFTMDKRLEHTWDEMVSKFLTRSRIPYTTT